VTFRAVNGLYEDPKRLIFTILAAPQQRDSCELLRVVGDVEAGTFTFYELWRKLKSHQVYQNGVAKTVTSGAYGLSAAPELNHRTCYL